MSFLTNLAAVGAPDHNAVILATAALLGLGTYYISPSAQATPQAQVAEAPKPAEPVFTPTPAHENVAQLVTEHVLVDRFEWEGTSKAHLSLKDGANPEDYFKAFSFSTWVCTVAHRGDLGLIEFSYVKDGAWTPMPLS